MLPRGFPAILEKNSSNFLKTHQNASKRIKTHQINRLLLDFSPAPFGMYDAAAFNALSSGLFVGEAQGPSGGFPVDLFQHPRVAVPSVFSFSHLVLLGQLPMCGCVALCRTRI
jgi:hypothetical protein